MRLHLRLVGRRTGRADDVVLTAEPETDMAEVVAALGRVQEGTLFGPGGPLATRGQLGASGLLDGAVLAVGQPLPSADGSGPLELAVVGGPSIR